MSRLEDISAPFREAQLNTNDYKTTKLYDAANPDALSTGDEQGKGENNGSVGSATDIRTRNGLLAKNKYNSNHEYNAGTV